MKIRDALWMGAKNLKVYKKRNLMIMGVMGVIFGVMLVMNLGLTGMEKAYVKYAGKGTEGKIVIEASNGEVTDEAGAESREEMARDIEKYGGRVLGMAERVGRFGRVVVPEDLVRENIEVSLEKVPEGAVPILVTGTMAEQMMGKSLSTDYWDVEKKAQDYEELRSEVIGKTWTDVGGTEYFVVGWAPGNFQVSNLSFRQLERGNDNVLNPILNYVNTPESRVIAIDNGKSESWRVNREETNGEGEAILAVFDTEKQAEEYLRKGRGRFMNVELGKRDYAVRVVAGMSPEVGYVFGILKGGAGVVMVILGVIAGIVVLLTSVRLMEQEKRNIKIYYSLGATTGQVKMIYLGYFLELMAGAAILAMGLASVIVAGFSLANQELLSAQAMLGFGLVEAPKVMWYGVNWGTLAIILVMVALAGGCVMVNGRRLRKVGK